MRYFQNMIFFKADGIAFGDNFMWYTYNSENTICLGFSECQEISEELCAPCVSGQPACIVEEDLPPCTYVALYISLGFM